MKRQVQLLIFFSIISVWLVNCTKKGKAIAEPKFGTYKFTTYTVDTFRFRVLLNEEVLTDSLLSPQSSISKQVNFYDVTGRVKIIDTKSNQVILDSAISMKIGTTTFSVVQFASGERPFIPAPPNEPAPAAGNYKIRFQYVTPASAAVPYFDSVKCIIRIQDATAPGGYSKLDSAILEKGELTKFYDTTLSLRYRITLLDPVSNAQITSPTQPVIDLGNPPSGFNTAIMRGIGTTSPSQGPYRFELRKIY